MSVEHARSTLLRTAVGVDGPAVPTAADWDLWRDLAIRERVVPLLYDVTRRVGNDLPPAVVERAEALQVEIAALSVRLEQSLLDVAGWLRQTGTPFAVLKGIATAHLDYGDPADRQFGDVDVLVDPVDMPRSRQVLEARGWAQAYPLPRHHERFTHAVAFRAAGIAEIDVHQRIGHRALGLRIPTSELLDARRPFTIAGQRLWALSDLDRLIHACVHAVASRGQYRRLSSVADVLVLSRAMPDAAPAVLERAEGWRVRAIVEKGVRLAHAEAMLDVPQPWSVAMARPTLTRDRLVEWAYLGDRRHPALEEAAHLRSMSAWSDRLLYLYGHLRMDSGPGSGGLAPRLRYLRSRLRERT